METSGVQWPGVSVLLPLNLPLVRKRMRTSGNFSFPGEFERGVLPWRMTEWRPFKCSARLDSFLSRLPQLPFRICIVLRHYILELERK